MLCPCFEWPATFLYFLSHKSPQLKGFYFIYQIFISSGELIIYPYNSESDIRQLPWNNHFPFAHNTLIIHIFSTLHSSLSPLVPPLLLFFPFLWSAQHLVRDWGCRCLSSYHADQEVRSPRRAPNKEETGCEIKVVGHIKQLFCKQMLWGWWFNVNW